MRAPSFLLPLVALLAWLIILPRPAHSADAPVAVVGFGSCARQDRDQRIWSAVIEQKPGLFLLLGDNIYGDSEDPEVLKAKYAQFAANAGYQKLRAQCPVLATWDDHDFGKDDAGAEFPAKKLSEKLFEEFFQLPADSPVRARDGVYSSAMFGPEGKRLQVILLDTRYFRSPLKKGGDGKSYVPDDDPAATLLGEPQWTWLQEELRKPAEVRLIGSSIQFVAEQHRFEKWANFPRERARMIDLLRQTGANGVIILSGDRHMAEIAALPPAEAGGYPLYDVTSSGLTQAGGGGGGEPNRFRVGPGNFRKLNFGTIRIDWESPDPGVTMEIRGVDGAVVLTHAVKLSELRK